MPSGVLPFDSSVNNLEDSRLGLVFRDSNGKLSACAQGVFDYALEISSRKASLGRNCSYVSRLSSNRLYLLLENAEGRASFYGQEIGSVLADMSWARRDSGIHHR
ncbi:predicted protein [Sclerotinia sclerotiorum 1980 UF-70]|uniref:Uncharacterized protein n=1 Tax=Sclerotinia sclerotiorum (strain ATCC 18683 / 1980 / Ss-1) TaxID=665079 RepID=A7EZH6_SCLS1|nr:predicted protein [Sclerotinia sclerotiorum 1980 UF-70]EDN94868.1 predicted protein [Sclerotinia sclerotiorum 1980 UF-70]